MEQPRFEMASGVELVRIAENRYTLRSEFDAFELSGEAASEFAKQVLLDWDAPRTLDELVSRMPSFSAESVRQQVGLLVSQGLIEEIRSPSAGVAPSLVRFLRSAGLAEAESIERLGSLRIGIFGLEAHGVHLALLLSQLGVGKLRLLDPYPCTAAHEELVSLLGNSSRGRSLQAATASIVAPNRSDIEAGPEIGEIDEAHIEQFVQECDLVIGCWDQSLSVATHWLNKAAQRFGVPALFGELHATSTWAGPLVLPGRSACWMCYRMRSIACAPDFEQAMAFEEHLEQHRKPRLSTRPLFPFLPEMLAMSLAMETIRFTLGLGAPILIDSVLEHDALTGATESHPLLPVPHCPVCSKKKRFPTSHPRRADFRSTGPD